MTSIFRFVGVSFEAKTQNDTISFFAELLNFLSRVPDGPTIEKCFNEIEPKKDPKKDPEDKKTLVARNGSKILATATTSASATFQRLNARKTSFLQAKFAKKISKAEL